MDGSPDPGDASGRMSAPAPCRAQIPRDTFFFLTGGLLLYNMVLVSLIHQHGSAVCVTCPPSRTSLPSRLSQSPCVSSLSHAAHSPRCLFYTSWCARFHATLSTRPTLSLASVSTSLLFMRDTRSVSPWAQCRPCGQEPRGDAQGIRKETDSSLPRSVVFPCHSPRQGVSLYRITVQPAFLETSPWVHPASSGPRGPWAQSLPGLVITCKL